MFGFLDNLARCLVLPGGFAVAGLRVSFPRSSRTREESITLRNGVPFTRGPLDMRQSRRKAVRVRADAEKRCVLRRGNEVI
jgi:hypothetical protein